MHPLLYYPNLVDYARIAALLAGLFLTFQDSPQWISILLFAVSAVLDLLDGILARRFSQQSLLGATLDMAIDRCTETLLSMRISMIDESHSFYFCLAVFVDIFSHWLRFTYSCARHAHHKDIERDAPLLLRYYYSRRWVLGLLCFGYDAFLILYYGYITCYPGPARTALGALSVICLPLALYKILISAIQAWDSLLRLAAQEVADRDLATQKNQENQSGDRTTTSPSPAEPTRESAE